MFGDGKCIYRICWLFMIDINGYQQFKASIVMKDETFVVLN
jgi:hypothetical protein